MTDKHKLFRICQIVKLSRIISCESIKLMRSFLKGVLSIQQIESSDKLHERASVLKGRESRDCTSTGCMPGAKIAPMEVTQRGAAHDANDTRSGQREFFVPVAIYICGSRGGGELESGVREGETTQNKLLADVEH